MRILLLLLTLLLPAGFVQANPTLQGDWMIELKPSGAAVVGLLQLERDGDDWKGFVEGGPAPVTVDGDKVEIVIDSRDLRGFIFFMRLSGELHDDSLAGTFAIESEAEVKFTGGTWTARRYTPAPRASVAKPVDLTGIWTPARGRDFRKYSMDLTPSADAWLDDYLMHYDQPNIRCASPGIVAMVAWGAYPFEVLGSDDRLTFIYEFDSEVRRIFNDGREAPEYYPHSPMGFSTSRWEGSEFVVTTTLLSMNVRDFRGEPISEQARLEEVYTLSEDGQSMTAVITLHDPENYKRPPIRRRAWTRKPAALIYPNECDPDSFYRQMYNEDLLNMYFERARRRF